MLLDFESLRCFVVVAAQLNFREAANRLALSPAALSDRIRRLEEDLSTPLFHRTTRKVTLTPAGERLLPHARQLLEANEGSFAIVNGALNAAPLELLVGTRFELGLSWLVPALPALEQVSPARRLNLHFGDGPELLTKLKQGLLDCVVTSSRFVEGGFEYATIHPEHFVLVGSKRLLRGHLFRGAVDAPRYTLIDLSADLPLSRYLLDQGGGNAHWKFARIEHLGTIGAVRLRVLQDKGIAVLPEYFVAEDLKRGRMQRLLPKLKLQTDHFRLMWRKDHLKADALKRLAEELRGLPLR